MLSTTNQQFLDILAPLVLAQGPGVRSQDAGGGCYYRHPEQPLSCWIGLLIPNDRYVPEMETTGNGVSNNPLVQQVLEDIYGPDIDFDFLARVQDAHDLGQTLESVAL